MRRKAAVALLLALVCGAPFVLAEGPEPEHNALAENAALAYWRAFAMIPNMTAEEEEMVLAAMASLTVPLGQQTDKLVADWGPALKLLHEGAATSACEWGVDLSKEGPATLLPHLSKARQLARGAWFRSCYFWERGQKQAAVEDLKAAVILARHTGARGRGLLISVLVQIAIENALVKGAARYLTDVEAADALDRVMADLSAMPNENLISNAFLVEKQTCLGWYIDRLRSGKGEDIAQSLAGEVPGIPGGQSSSELLRLLEETGRHYEEMAEIFGLPPRQSAARWAAFTKQVEASGNPFTKLIVPAVYRAREAELELRTRWAMLRAGIAVRKRGPQALQTVKDPYDDLPFEYAEHDGTFELTSRLTTRDGEPVSLSFGGSQAAATGPNDDRP